MKTLLIAVTLTALCTGSLRAAESGLTNKDAKPGHVNADADKEGKSEGKGDMKILSGSAKVTMADGTQVTLNAGDTIPSGSKVEALDGGATFQSGTAVVKAEAGESFSFSSTGGNPQIKSENGTILVTIGRTVATLDKGDGISVQGQGGQQPEIKVTSGSVSMTNMDGTTTTVQTGGTANTEPPENVPVDQQASNETQTQTTAPNPTQETTTTPVSPSSP